MTSRGSSRRKQKVTDDGVNGESRIEELNLQLLLILIVILVR